jgi:hypothetical protein
MDLPYSNISSFYTFKRTSNKEIKMPTLYIQNGKCFVSDESAKQNESLYIYYVYEFRSNPERNSFLPLLKTQCLQPPVCAVQT